MVDSWCFLSYFWSIIGEATTKADFWANGEDNSLKVSKLHGPSASAFRHLDGQSVGEIL